MFAKIAKFLRNEDGPTAVEYSVMLAMIIVICLFGIASVGTETNEFFNDSAQDLNDILN